MRYTLMKQLSQNISSNCRGDNVDIKYTTTTTPINESYQRHIYFK